MRQNAIKIDNIKKIQNDLKLNDLEEIYLSIGTLRFTAGYIISLTTDTKESIEDALIEKVSRTSLGEKNYKNDI